MLAKKILSFALCLAMLCTMCAVAPALAEGEPNIIVISSCDSINGWSGYPEDKWALDKQSQVEGKGCIRYYQIGGVSPIYVPESPLDLTGMKYFVFDFKPQDIHWFQKTKNAELILSSAEEAPGYIENNDPTWNSNSLRLSLADLVFEEGWNTVNIPLDLTKATAGFDISKITQIMIYGQAYTENGNNINTNYIDNVRASDQMLEKTPQVDPAIVAIQSVFDHARDIYQGGQRTYTASSWDKFVAAYEKVEALNLSFETSEMADLVAAKRTLQNGMNFLTSKTNKNELDELYEHVVVLGIDGLGNFDTKTDTPNIDRIAAQPDTLYTHSAQSVLPSISAQNWGAMLLGVSPDKHGKTNEGIESTPTNDYQTYPSIFRYLRDKYPEAELDSFNNWSAINNGIVEHNLGVNMYSGEDDTLTESIIDNFENSNPLFTFVQFDSVDHAGHASGYQSESYFAHLRAVDGYIGQIYDALDSNGYLDNTLLIILTDHGGIGTNHGGNTPEELNCSYYAKGKSVTPGEFTETLTTATLSSVVAAALGVPQSGEYDYTVPNGYFKGYTYKAPENEDWKLSNPVRKYRNHQTTTETGEEYALDKFVDTSSLKAHFKFDSNLNNSVENSTITATINGNTMYKDGYYGKSISLGTSYVSVDGIDVGDNSYTISAWFKDIYVPAGDPALFGNKDWNSGANQGMTLAAEKTEEGSRIRFNTADADGRYDTEYTPIDSYDFSTQESGWVNVMVVVNREDAVANLYIDFKLVDSINIGTGSFATPEGLSFNIGSDGTGTLSFKAYFSCDDFLYFDKAINESEVSSLQTYYNMTAEKAAVLKAVNNTYSLIKEIGEVTESNFQDKLPAIQAAETAYAELTEDFGAQQVDNLPALSKARADYDSYVNTTIYGDLDNNKKVETKDALMALQAAVGKIELTNAQKVAADVDGKPGITTADALYILQKAVMKIDKFPVEQ